ncbi:hypothetical protein HJ014_22550 [Vibrio parahaemolyticus]|uniref:hypothetical protein n=1 Tax=Vibrio parahaemolyticus TaxID=670 RepID=UPI001869D219|nr:hypothetical protein [Vibrio parahaemolyticus]MBE4467409.1 hypothetical protein [Vibrio parahaemolyticus]MCG9638325.1 hypothetical protein [Vibrio parahaemolyticus]HCE4695047.1 hypothetical protein [Vibrio parahaemolyticus]
MATGIPKTIESEIFDILNESIDSGSSLQDIELQKLIRMAKTLQDPVKSVCLTALYSHSLKYELAADSAVKCFQSQRLDRSCVENTLSALSNARMFSEVVNLSKQYPFVLDFQQARIDCYESALYLLDLQYCEYIFNNFRLELSEGYFTHEKVISFFNDDSDLINRASDYFNYVFKSLREVLKLHSMRSASLELGLVHSAYSSSIELAIYIKDRSFDEIMSIESDWLDRISLYEVSDEILCDISFVIGEAN